jgi:hypothetical protein
VHALKSSSIYAKKGILIKRSVKIAIAKWWGRDVLKSKNAKIKPGPKTARSGRICVPILQSMESNLERGFFFLSK